MDTYYHHKDGNLVPLAAPAGEKEIGKSVRALPELLPGDLAAEGLTGFGLHERVVTPGNAALRLKHGVDLNQCHLIGVKSRVVV